MLESLKKEADMPITITERQADMARKPQKKRMVMDMDGLSDRLAKIALPLVKNALEAEMLNTGADAWKAEGEQALRALLRDEGILSLQDPKATHLLESLKNELKNPSPPDEEDIQQHAKEVGRIMASSWVQFIALALRISDKLLLGESLLPGKDQQVREELWNALRSSLNSLAVNGDDASVIMRDFAESVVANSGGIELPMGITLDLASKPSCYIVRRR